MPARTGALDPIWVGCTYMSTIQLVGTYKVTPIAVADAQLLQDCGPEPVIMAMGLTQVGTKRILVAQN